MFAEEESGDIPKYAYCSPLPMHVSTIAMIELFRWKEDPSILHLVDLVFAVLYKLWSPQTVVSTLIHTSWCRKLARLFFCSFYTRGWGIRSTSLYDYYELDSDAGTSISIPLSILGKEKGSRFSSHGPIYCRQQTSSKCYFWPTTRASCSLIRKIP